jgi:CheY-like chemotaxis protein
MDGRTVREQQMADPKLAKIPVIVCSAYDIAGIFGPVYSIKKPVDLPVLLSMVAASLSGGSPAP